MGKDLELQTFMWAETNESRLEPKCALADFMANKYFKYGSYSHYRSSLTRIDEYEAPYYMEYAYLWFVTDIETGREYIYVAEYSKEEV